MAQFSGLCPFGLFRFTSAPTPAEEAYKAYVAGLGTKAFNLVQTGSNEIEAKVYATVIQAGVARACGIEKAWNQQLPLSASDKLPSLEADWGVTVNPQDSLQTQQQKVAAQYMLQRGARQEAVESALHALLGTGFYALRVTGAGEQLFVPAPPVSSSVGSWQVPDAAPKYIQLLQPVLYRSTTNTFLYTAANGLKYTLTGTLQAVQYQLLGGSTQLQVGDVVTINPDHGTRAEAVTVVAVTIGTGANGVAAGTTLLGAAFTQPHDVGTLGMTCCPWWKSNQRHVRVIVSRAVAANQELRRQINELMAKHMKSCTSWDICAVTPSSVVQTGQFTFGTSLIGADALGNVPFTY